MRQNLVICIMTTLALALLFIAVSASAQEDLPPPLPNGTDIRTASPILPPLLPIGVPPRTNVSSIPVAQPAPAPLASNPVSNEELFAVLTKINELKSKIHTFKAKSDALSDFFKKTGELSSAERYSAASGIFSEIKQEIDETAAAIRASRGDAAAVKKLIRALVEFVRRKADEALVILLSSSTAKPCKVTGCSGQICSDEDVITTCEFHPEYACYRTARCEHQQNGRCEWTITPELSACIGQEAREATLSIEEGRTQTIILAGAAHTILLDIVISTDKVLLNIDGTIVFVLYGEMKQLGDIIVRVDNISLEGGKRAVITILVA